MSFVLDHSAGAPGCGNLAKAHHGRPAATSPVSLEVGSFPFCLEMVFSERALVEERWLSGFSMIFVFCGLFLCHFAFFCLFGVCFLEVLIFWLVQLHTRCFKHQIPRAQLQTSEALEHHPRAAESFSGLSLRMASGALGGGRTGILKWHQCVWV